MSSDQEEPIIHGDNVPAIKCNMSVNEAKTLAQWTTIFVKTLDEVSYAGPSNSNFDERFRYSRQSSLSDEESKGGGEK